MVGFQVQLNNKKKSVMKNLIETISYVTGSIMRRVQRIRKPQIAEEIPPIYAGMQLDAGSMVMPNVMIEGQLNCSEDLIINGQFKGSIRAENNNIAVGLNGQVNANIIANKLLIEGAVTGDITSKKRVVITKTGKVTGTIQAAVVDLENGARFKGVIEMDPEEAETVESQTQMITQSETDRLVMEPS